MAAAAAAAAAALVAAASAAVSANMRKLFIFSENTSRVRPALVDGLDGMAGYYRAQWERGNPADTKELPASSLALHLSLSAAIEHRLFYRGWMAGNASPVNMASLLTGYALDLPPNLPLPVVPSGNGAAMIAIDIRATLAVAIGKNRLAGVTLEQLNDAYADPSGSGGVGAAMIHHLMTVLLSINMSAAAKTAWQTSNDALHSVSVALVKRSVDVVDVSLVPGIGESRFGGPQVDSGGGYALTAIGHDQNAWQRLSAHIAETRAWSVAEVYASAEYATVLAAGRAIRLAAMQAYADHFGYVLISVGPATHTWCIDTPDDFIMPLRKPSSTAPPTRYRYYNGVTETTLATNGLLVSGGLFDGAALIRAKARANSAGIATAAYSHEHAEPACAGGGSLLATRTGHLLAVELPDIAAGSSLAADMVPLVPPSLAAQRIQTVHRAHAGGNLTASAANPYANSSQRRELSISAPTMQAYLAQRAPGDAVQRGGDNPAALQYFKVLHTTAPVVDLTHARFQETSARLQAGVALTTAPTPAVVRAKTACHTGSESSPAASEEEVQRALDQLAHFFINDQATMIADLVAFWPRFRAMRHEQECAVKNEAEAPAVRQAAAAWIEQHKVVPRRLGELFLEEIAGVAGQVMYKIPRILMFDVDQINAEMAAAAAAHNVQPTTPTTTTTATNQYQPIPSRYSDVYQPLPIVQ